MADNPFADLVPSGKAPSVLYGPPKIEEPKTTYRTLTEQEASQRGLPAGIWQIDSNGKIDRIGEASAGNDTLQAAIKDLSLDELIAGVNKARAAAKTGWATGFAGAVGGLKPGSTRNDYLGFLEQIQGGIIMEKLQALKDASKTGASGMGALSEREGQRLASSVAALNGDMSADAAINSLDDIARHALTLKAIADGADPRDPVVQKKYGIPPLTDPGNGPDKGKDKILDPNMGQRPGEAPPIDVEVTGGRDPTDAEIAANPGKYPDAEARKRAEAEVERQKRFEDSSIAGGQSDVRRVLTQGISLGLSDEAMGVGNAISGILTGRNPVEAYTTGRDAERLRIEDARKQLGYASTPIEIAGGFLSANPEAALAPIVSRANTIRQGIRSGAAGGALAGFGYGEGAEGSMTDAAIGAAGGGLIGGSLSALSTRVGSKAVDPALGDVVRASDEEGVNLFRPMVDDSSRAKFGVREAQSGSGPVIREGMNKTVGQIESGIERLGAGGNSLDELSMGELVQSAARRDHAYLKGVRTKLYQRAEAGAKADGDPDINPVRAIAKVDEQIAQLKRLPTQNDAEITMLEGLKSDLSQPGLKLQDIRDMRTGIRSRVSGDLLGTQADRRVGQVLDAARDDIAAAVSDKTAAAYTRADTFEAKRREYVTDTIEKFIGRKGQGMDAGKAFDRLKALASPRGDGKRLAAFYRRLDPGEQADVSASFANALGGGEGKFSLNTLLQQTKKLSPSARETIFGPAGKRSLDNLNLLARRVIDARSDVNFSKSGKTAGNMFAEGFRNMLIAASGLGAAYGTQSVSTGIAAGAAALAATTAPAVTRSLSARAMMSPRLTRWAAQAMMARNPAQAKIAIQQLSTIAAREPAIAGEVNQLQQSLNQAMLPAAASGEESQNDDGGGQ